MNNQLRELIDKVNGCVQSAIQNNNFEEILTALHLIKSSYETQGYTSPKKFVNENCLYESSNHLIAAHSKGDCLEGVVLNLSSLGVATEKIIESAKKAVGINGEADSGEATKEYKGINVYLHNSGLIGFYLKTPAVPVTT